MKMHRMWRLSRVAVGVALMWILPGAGCSRHAPAPTAPAGVAQTPESPALTRALAIQDRHTDRLMKTAGVVGVATGRGRDGRPTLIVFTDGGQPDGLPGQIEGIPVEVVASGPFEPWAQTGRFRPLANGISLDNNNQCSIGTLGCVVARGSKRYVLSCNHVLARQNAALIGETIVQPARTDNHPTCADRSVTDRVATLTDFVPLRFDGTDNVMDAAIAQLEVDATCRTLPEFYGAAGSTIVPATVGLAVKKVGRTTELTTGTVTAINATFDVTYAAGTARFTGLIVTSNGFGKRGDSGSLMVTGDNASNPVGMVFGGDNHGSAIVIPIQPVLDRFNVQICRP